MIGNGKEPAAEIWPEAPGDPEDCPALRRGSPDGISEAALDGALTFAWPESDDPLQISVTGISHRTAPIGVRERFALGPDDLPAALGRLTATFGAAAILSTCNRTEVYLACPESRINGPAIIRALAPTWDGSGPHGSIFYHHTGAEAAQHLFRVASGLDSLVVGESEILGQVRAALSAAVATGSSDNVLARLFHAAMRVGRRARSETAIGHHNLSISSIAVSLSRNVLGDLDQKTVLVVGAGEAGRLAARALAQTGAHLLVANRSFERAQALASDLGGAPLPFDALGAAFERADVVITCTGSPTCIVSRDMVGAALPSRDGKPLVFIDIAVPRDVEPAVGSLPGVCLFDVDDLDDMAEANRRQRQLEVDAVEEIIASELVRFQAWLGGLCAVPTISAIRERAEIARQTELHRTLGRMKNLAEADRERIEAMSKALVKRILHDPVTRLRAGTTARRYLGAARHLFGVDETADRP